VGDDGVDQLQGHRRTLTAVDVGDHPTAHAQVGLGGQDARLDPREHLGVGHALVVGRTEEHLAVDQVRGGRPVGQRVVHRPLEVGGVAHRGADQVVEVQELEEGAEVVDVLRVVGRQHHAVAGGQLDEGRGGDRALQMAVQLHLGHPSDEVRVIARDRGGERSGGGAGGGVEDGGGVDLGHGGEARNRVFRRCHDSLTVVCRSANGT
jgi:hypothetical protein